LARSIVRVDREELGGDNFTAILWKIGVRAGESLDAEVEMEGTER
jgi:hypothetical protein